MQNIIKTLITLTLFSCNAIPSNPNIQDKTEKKDTTQTNQNQTTPKVDNNISFDTYCNERFAYCVDYPKALVYPRPESKNGDGRIFKKKKR